MQKERNYINAIVEFRNDGVQTEVIFKVGDVDFNDDMHVFGYLKTEKEMEDLSKKRNIEFKVLEYWKGKRRNNMSDEPCTSKEWDAFFGENGKSHKYEPE